MISRRGYPAIMTTMKEIAKLAGVHVTTVSLVLSGQDKKYGISTARSEEIRSIAERLGYRRNAAALAINRGRFGTIGLVMGHRWSLGHLPRPMLNGISMGLGERGLQLLFAQLPDEEALRAETVPRLLRERSCDGLLISYDEGSPIVLNQLIQRYSVPAIWMNLRREADCVHPDDFGSGRAATEFLLAMGHRRIAYSNFYWSGATEAQLLDAHYSMRDRRDGCLSILERAGLTPLPGLVQMGEDQSSAATASAAERLLRRPDRPTAVICFSLGDAEGLMIAANTLGLSIPGDLSLICFGPEPIRILGLELSTMIVPVHQVGYRAVTQLQRRIAAPTLPLPPEVVPGELQRGASCAAPAA